MKPYHRKDEEELRKLSLLAIPFRLAPLQACILIGLTILDGLSLPYQVQITTKLINRSIEQVSSGGSVQSILDIIFVFCLLLGYQWISTDVKNLIGIPLNLSITKYCDELCINKIARIPYAHIENQDSWNLIYRVKNHFSNNVTMLFYNVLSLLTLLINVIGVLAIIFLEVWWASFVILFVMFPLSFLVRKSSKETYKGEVLVTERSRYADYLDHLLCNNKGVEERCFFGYGDYLNSTYKRYYEDAQKVRFQMKRVWYARMKLGSIVSSFAFATILFAFAQPVLTQRITIGFFSSISYAVFSLIQSLSWNLTSYIDHITMVFEYQKDLSSFLQLEEVDHSLVLPSQDVPELITLEFSHVSFSYPGTQKLALDDLSFILEGKNCYAFVGENGSGKSTIIKLISGLYEDYSGTIRINGIDIKEYSLDVLRGMIHTLFQDYGKYPITLRDNILLGDILNLEDNEEKLMNAVNLLHINEFVGQLPKALNTTLGKLEEDSVELSGGQWQKVAIMRALVNQAPLKILDEPTAALDPISESRLYQEFKTLMTKNTSILISHRLGSTMLADKIFVIQDGKVKEEGTHAQLMDLGGVYYSMYQSQKEWYAI